MWFIVTVTDCIDAANSEVRAQIYKFLLKEKVLLKDISLEPPAPTKPLSIANGSFLIRLLAEDYPQKTIIYSIINPLTEQPERIIGRAKNGIIFIGRNTGAFGWLAKDIGCTDLYKIPITKHVPFGGKYVYPQYIAKIIKYDGNLDLMAKAEGLIKMNKSLLKTVPKKFGEIVHIDNFGLLKIAMPASDLRKSKIKENDNVKIIVNNKRVFHGRYLSRLLNGNKGEVIVYPGSSFGLLEVGIVKDPLGFKNMDLKIGDRICIKKI